MIEKVYEVIDKIDESNIKRKLDKVKNHIKNSEEAKRLIKKFQEAKELYEKFNVSEDFLKAKEELVKNELLKEYIELQNKINMLTLHINNRIKMITEGVTSKK